MSNVNFVVMMETEVKAALEKGSPDFLCIFFSDITSQ